MRLLDHLSLCMLLSLGMAAGQESTHPATLWKSIAAHGYAVPEGASADELALELSGLLGSPDPVLRDDLAYSILARWIARPGMLPAETLTKLTDKWRNNLTTAIGEEGTNSVLLRSFSALCLASMARREARAPFMGTDRYHQLVRSARSYLIEERDLRGWDPILGWIHAAAHTGDLLEGLAASPLMTRDEEAGIFEAVGVRLAKTPHVYTQGEQDRLAAAMAKAISRPDFDRAVFDKWIDATDTSDQNVWKIPLTQESLAHYQNHTYMLQALAVHLMLEPDQTRVTDIRAKVLAVLKAR